MPSLTVTYGATQAVAMTLILLGLTPNAEAAVVINSEGGWEASITGSLPVFMVMSDGDSPAPGVSGEDGTRIQSGFNPANLTFHVAAPSANGFQVSAHVQFDTHLNGNSQNDNSQFESRVAEIQVQGRYGTVRIGKGFGIFNSAAIGDIASQGGVGLLGGEAADSAGATGGRIGTGYVYANFNPHITYTSANIGGVKIEFGIVNPEEPGGQSRLIETDTPRFEGQIDYAKTYHSGSIRVWSGFMHQEVSVVASDFDYDMQGFDIGGHLDHGVFGLTLSITDTTGIGANGLYGTSLNDAEVRATQWYIEADVNTGKTIYGISYGEGEQNQETTIVGSAEDEKNELAMLFVHHKLTPQLKLIGELQSYESDTLTDYNALSIGAQFDF